MLCRMPQGLRPVRWPDVYLRTVHINQVKQSEPIKLRNEVFFIYYLNLNTITVFRNL